MCLQAITRKGFETRGIGWKLVLSTPDPSYFLCLCFPLQAQHRLPRGVWLTADVKEIQSERWSTRNAGIPDFHYSSGFHIVLGEPWGRAAGMMVSTLVLYRKGRILGNDSSVFGRPYPTVVADQIYFPLPTETITDLRKRLKELPS